MGFPDCERILTGLVAGHQIAVPRDEVTQTLAALARDTPHLRLGFEPDQLVLRAGQVRRIAGDWSGPSMEIFIDAGFFTEAVNATVGPDLVIEASDPLAPDRSALGRYRNVQRADDADPAHRRLNDALRRTIPPRRHPRRGKSPCANSSATGPFFALCDRAEHVGFGARRCPAWRWCSRCCPISHSASGVGLGAAGQSAAGNRADAQPAA